MQKKVTTRKVKILGQQEFIDKESGEIKAFNVIDIEERDANFHKFWLFNVMTSLNLIGNQKMKFAFWLLDNMNYENRICMTMRQMADNSKISLDTVTRTIKTLINSDFIVRENIGVYRINPNCVFSGTKQQRLRILLDYHSCKKDNTK